MVIDCVLVSTFFINKIVCIISDPVVNVMISSTNLDKSVKFWNGILGLKIFSQTEAVVELGFGDDQAKLKLKYIGKF